MKLLTREQNRRLRHLHGISLRNLNIRAPNSRSRKKTFSEDDSNITSHARRLIRNENQILHHAKSYDQLLKASTSEGNPSSTANDGHGSVSSASKRPAAGKMRRRSTLHWATSSPRSRQSKLEAVEATHLVASWFSLHHHQLDGPLYVSEVLQDSMNPTFSFFDLDTSAAYASRSTSFTLKIWSKGDAMQEYLQLLELQVDLRSLQFIGKSLEHFHHPLPENCVVFHLSDGVYTSFTDLPAENVQQPLPTTAMQAMAQTQHASFNTLIKLTNLDDVIHDALRTRAALEADINQLVASMNTVERGLAELSSQREQTRSTLRAQEAEQKTIEYTSKLKLELQDTIQAKRSLLSTRPGHELEQQALREGLTSSASKTQKELDQLGDKATAQTRRICSGLLQIFPIEPIKGRTLQFTIRNIHLPNSSFSDTNGDEIAAALGFAAQLVYQLSLYLSVPLPYSVQPDGSNSFISDGVSAAIAQRQFPLHPNGAAYKFEYGVFLLNKDIEFLMSRSGLRVMDIRHTLPNLKYLMFVLTSGTGDMPGRKVGGIRGLLRSGVSPSISRRNSDDSVVSSNSAALQEKLGDGDDVFTGPVRARGLPYRKSMLRDAG